MMHSNLSSKWYVSGLFWRTFLLLASLIGVSALVWVLGISYIEKKPRIEQLSRQITSIVTLTRAALTHTEPVYAKSLMLELAKNEGVRVYVYEDNDEVEDLDDSYFYKELANNIRHKLGNETQFAQSVNGEDGFWLSFNIEGDKYWLLIENQRVAEGSNLQMAGLTTLTLLLSLIGAIFISRRINFPLSQISKAAHLFSKGNRPPPLPYTGPSEVRETNASFNQMVDNLIRVDEERTEILAGISHDLRTPLTRMQLEIEMAHLDEETRHHMIDDVAQMNAIIRQFLDYAKPLNTTHFAEFNLSDFLDQLFCHYKRNINTSHVAFQLQIEPNMLMLGDSTHLARLINNLMENAIRYGMTPSTEKVAIDFSCFYQKEPLPTEYVHRKSLQPQAIVMIFRDHGSGISQQDIPRLTQAFTRGDASRSQANGAGLGLAIIKRITQHLQGEMKITNHPEGGLQIHFYFS